MGGIYFDLTVIICLAASLAILFRFLKQPPVLAYIIVGVIIAPLGIGIEGQEAITSLAEIGITLLLFMLGLELRFSELRSVGKIAITSGVAQISLTFVAGFLVCLLLGYSQVTAIYISLALTFSSTIIIVKLLSDKKDLNSLYGKISVGILLLQDFVAIFALIILSGFSGGKAFVPQDLFLVGLKAVVLFGWVLLLSRHLLPKLLDKIAYSGETLFLFSLAWAFGLSALVSSSYIGFSIEIGGFLAGLALANSSENHQIITKVKPLRDFFITLFFVTLGAKLVLSEVSTIIVPAAILSLFVLIVNPLIVMAIMGFLGYRKRTGFLAGLTLAQISEFSLILMFMGNRVGHISNQTVALVTVVGAVTFVTSTYMIMNGNYLYKLVSRFLNVFEKDNAREKRVGITKFEDHVVLVGARVMGEGILEALIKEKDNKVVVVDFDPDIIDALNEDQITSFYGDIADPEIQELANITKARLIISTVSDPEDNLLLLKSIKKLKQKPIIVVAALEKHDARELYKEGADYVVMPHVAGGHHLAKILVDKDHLELIEKYKEKDLKGFLG